MATAVRSTCPPGEDLIPSLAPIMGSLGGTSTGPECCMTSLKMRTSTLKPRESTKRFLKEMGILCYSTCCSKSLFLLFCQLLFSNRTESIMEKHSSPNFFKFMFLLVSLTGTSAPSMSYAPNRTTESTLRDRDSYLSKALFFLDEIIDLNHNITYISPVFIRID